SEEMGLQWSVPHNQDHLVCHCHAISFTVLDVTSSSISPIRVNRCEFHVSCQKIAVFPGRSSRRSNSVYKESPAVHTFAQIFISILPFRTAIRDRIQELHRELRLAKQPLAQASASQPSPEFSETKILWRKIAYRRVFVISFSAKDEYKLI